MGFIQALVIKAKVETKALLNCLLMGNVLDKRTAINRVVVIVSGLILIITSILVLSFNKVTGVMVIIPNFIELDGISLLFLVLTAIIFPPIYIYSGEFVVFSHGAHMLTLVVIQFLTSLAFCVNNLLVFYFVFEAVLFPMFILIGIWGSRGRRTHAVYQFFFFTAFGSIFILLGIIYLYNVCGTLCFMDLKYMNLELEDQIILGFLFFIGFMSKVPSIPLHIWLPEAHVEAPTTGSVILAALLLKFGFYGMYKTIVYICSAAAFKILSPFFFLICIISLVFSSITAIRQIDLKKIIAYSSIAHMNFSLLGICLIPKAAAVAANYLMFSHGLISGAMFFLVGFLYERFHTKNMIYFGGLAQLMPIFSTVFLIVMFSNMGLPGTSNFVGELIIFISAYRTNGLVFVFLISSVLLVSIFSLLALVRVIFYQVTGFLLSNKMKDLSFTELSIVGVLVVYIILFGIFPNLLISLLDGVL